MLFTIILQLLPECHPVVNLLIAQPGPCTRNVQQHYSIVEKRLQSLLKNVYDEGEAE